MSTDASEASHTTASDYVGDARALDRVIRVTDEYGAHVDYAMYRHSTYGEEFWFATHSGTSCSTQIAEIDSVLNAITERLPDVELVREENSLFGGSE